MCEKLGYLGLSRHVVALITLSSSTEQLVSFWCLNHACWRTSRLHNHDLWLTIDACAGRKFAFQRLSSSVFLSIMLMLVSAPCMLASLSAAPLFGDSYTIIQSTFNRGSDGKCATCGKNEGDHYGPEKFCYVSLCMSVMRRSLRRA